jgi:HSP20 family protein
MDRSFPSSLAALMALQQRISELFDEARAQRERVAEQAHLAPAFDLIAQPERYLLYVDLPDVPAEQVRVTVEEGVLVVQGQKPASQNGGGWVRQERAYGRFFRAIPLPSDADPSQASAALEAGVLKITIGRRGSAQRREIPVQEVEEPARESAAGQGDHKPANA